MLQHIRKRFGAEAIVCGLIGVLYLLVWPVGEYGINDDWAYVKSLEHLHFDGRLHILKCVTTALVGQLLWGLAFTKVFGFSFTVTKISVVALHAIECVVLLRILALCRVDRRLAVFGVVALTLSPLHVANAFTFMSDIPAMAFQLISLFCYLKAILPVPTEAEQDLGVTAVCAEGEDSALRQRSARAAARELAWLAAGSLAAGEAFLIRQNGVLVPAAFCVYLALFNRRYLTITRCASACVPLGLFVAGFTYYQRVFGQTTGYSNAIPVILDILRHPPLETPYILFAFLSYGGCFLIPLAGAMRHSLFRLRSKRTVIVFGAVALAAVDAFFYFGSEKGQVFPYIWNEITPFGLFRPDELVIGERDSLWGDVAGWSIGAASLVAALALVFSIVCGTATVDLKGEAANKYDCDIRLVATRLCSILFGLQVVYLFATITVLFDRHLLLFAPTVIVLFCLFSGSGRNYSLLRYLICLLPIGWYAVTTSHDLHALSRTAFLAGQYLVDRGVDPRTINAGYDFDGWHTYELVERHPNHEPGGRKQWWQISLWEVFKSDQHKTDPAIRWEHAWWVADISVSTERRYLVACSPGPDAPTAAGCATEKVFHYQNWWPWKVNSVAVFRREQP